MINDNKSLEIFESKTKGYINKGRTNYQIRHFVIGQHDTPEMQYHQIIVEAQAIYLNLQHMEIDKKILETEIERQSKSEDIIEVYKSEKNKIDLNHLKLSIQAAKEELKTLYLISLEYPEYTNEDIENNQEEYWEKRLFKQAESEILGNQKGISSGNIMAMLQANLIKREIQS